MWKWIRFEDQIRDDVIIVSPSLSYIHVFVGHMWVRGEICELSLLYFFHLFGRFTISVLGKFCPGQLGPSVRDPIHPNEVDVPGQNLEPQVPLPPLALSPDFCLFFMGFFFGFLFSSFFLLFLFCHLAAGLTQQGFHRSPETQKQIRQF